MLAKGLTVQRPIAYSCFEKAPIPSTPIPFITNRGSYGKSGAGPVASTDDYEKLMQPVREYAESYRTANTTRDKVGQRQADS